MTSPSSPDQADLAHASAIESDYYHFAVGADRALFSLRGSWTILNLAELEGIVERLGLNRIPVKSIEFQCGGIRDFDLSGAWLLFRTAEESRERYLWFVSVSAGLVATFVQPHKFRWIPTARHIQDAGVRAIGIVALMAFLVSVVLGFQSQDQLTQFGAQIFTVDLVSILEGLYDRAMTQGG